MSQYPFIKLVVPAALKAHKNGQLPDSLLASVKTGGRMHTPVAQQFNKMYDAALAAGFKLKNVGDYRSFASQLAMFRDRYVLENTGTGVTRNFEGKTWYLKKGKAPSATPDPTGLKGSNHGWGLAIDLGYDANGRLTSMGGACFAWMCANAPKYGFYLQGSDPKSKEFEAWHWQYCLGDSAPNPSAPVPSSDTLKPSGGSVEAGPMKFDYPGTPVGLGSNGMPAILVQSVIGGKTDGDFGAKSVEALKAWQKANGLATDGSVGPITWKKMFG